MFVNSSFASAILVENVFSDIDSNYIYRDELQTLYDRGTIVGDESGKFFPEAYLDRDEFVGISMEVICERCIQPHTEYKFLEAYFDEDVYYDIDNSNPYFYCVAEADAQNYVRGYDIGQECQDGTSRFGERPFCPLNRINLEEAIAVLLRNSGIFTIDDNAVVVQDIRSGNITAQLGNDVHPTDSNGNPYTFYGYLRKALDYQITEYNTDGSSKILRLLEPDVNGNINPQKQITKQEFLRMSYIALKSNSCSEIGGEELALKMLIWEDSCQPGESNCTLSDLNDPEDTYDFEPEVEGVCELGINDPTGYIWRFQNITNGEQFIRYGSYIDDYTLPSAGEWRIYLRVIDNCGNSSEVFSTIFVGDSVVDQEIDVDIDVYDDECSINSGCSEIEFYSEDDDNDDIFDFDGDVETTCQVGVIDYKWTFRHVESGNVYNYNQEYIDDILLGLTGEWFILLEVIDGCGQTGSEQMTYIIPETNPNPDPEVTDPEIEGDYIDIDIDVYDDPCTLGGGCSEIEFDSQEDDGDDTYDFHETVDTSCQVSGLEYAWEFQRQGSSEILQFTDEYVNDFNFFLPGVWDIRLIVTDACGQSASEEMTYIVIASGDSALNVGIIADPIYGYEDLLVDFDSVVSGGVGPYTYEWDFGDNNSDFGSDTEHLYTNDSVYEVELIVTDIYGTTGTATVVIVVLDRDSCEQDSDGDGIEDCDDLCPLVAGEESNSGCPIFETPCSASCGCEQGYTCSDSDPLTCGTGVCLPDFEPETSCLYSPNIGSIYGNAVCSTCPCDSYLDFLADVRRCDLVFPAITSPDAREIYSRGDIWQVQ